MNIGLRDTLLTETWSIAAELYAFSKAFATDGTPPDMDMILSQMSNRLYAMVDIIKENMNSNGTPASSIR